jgi:hypothetical protein
MAGILVVLASSRVLFSFWIQLAVSKVGLEIVSTFRFRFWVHYGIKGWVSLTCMGDGIRGIIVDLGRLELLLINLTGISGFNSVNFEMYSNQVTFADLHTFFGCFPKHTVHCFWTPG